MTPPPFISVVIPTRNRANDLAKCLACLTGQQSDDIEMIVCDDSDANETRDMLAARFPRVARHVGPRFGPGPNRNLGARVASGEWLIFVDDDCLPSPGFLAAYRESMAGFPAASRVALSGATYRVGPNETSLLWEAPDCSTRLEIPPSCNFAMRRELFLAVGGFDERYRTSFEDMEFFSRVTRLDCPVVFVPKAAVDHPSRPLPSPAKLATRWESRVVSSFDFGATTTQIATRLPVHIFRVILGRLRRHPVNSESFAVARIFCCEFLIALVSIPGWIMKFRNQPQSPFWRDQVSKNNAPPKFGL